MITWWAGLSTVLKVLWGITIFSSLIFVIQTVLTFIGAGGEMDADGFDGDFSDASDADLSGGSNIYTFRNLINFMLGFGWTAVLMYDNIPSLFLLILLSTAVGVALVAIVMWLFKWMSSMQQNGAINVTKSASGCEGTVYLTIPQERTGKGKVQISINNSIREYEAMTDGEELKTGTPIKVIEAISPSTLLVESTAVETLIV